MLGDALSVSGLHPQVNAILNREDLNAGHPAGPEGDERRAQPIGVNHLDGELLCKTK